MSIYFILLGMVVFVYLIPIKIRAKILSIGIILVVFSGFREGVGTDFNMYKNIFYNINKLDGYYFGDLERGYILLNKTLHGINPNHRILFIGTSAIIIGLILNSVYNYSKKYLLSIVLFICMGYFHSGFNGIRQHLALAIFVYSIRFIANKKIFKYVICIFIASLFHKTSLMMIPLYFINRIQFKTKSFLLTTIPILMIGLAYDFIIKYIVILSPYYYEKYLNTDYFKVGIGGTTNYIYILSLLIVYIISILMYNKISLEYKDVKIFIIIAGISLMFMILGLKSLLFFRISLYFSISFIFLIPMILDSINIKLRLAIYPIFTMWILFFYSTTLFYRDGVIPYIWK